MANLRARNLQAAATSLSTNSKTINQSFTAQKANTAAPPSRKRVKSEKGDAPVDASPAKKSRKMSAKAEKVQIDEVSLPFLSREEVIRATTIACPTLPFHLSDAVHHLRSVDVRFHHLLDTIELTPYKELENGEVKELDLFRTLASSVLGQQVSWLAARAILYRFIRLFFPHLPEKPDFNLTPRESLPFPHPIDVAKDECTIDILRSAGLSGAKVKYIKDIAKRFSDGRLDARRIIKMQEEECIEELVKIRGVGKWTAEMLLMFALRRANILPVGDLGVQRGMVLFFLADASGPSISKRKKKSTKEEGVEGANQTSQDLERKTSLSQETHLATLPKAEVEDMPSQSQEHQTGPSIIAPKDEKDTAKMQPLPEGISMSLLKSRNDGKKAKGNVYLTPPEMEALAEPWGPYRSVASFLMWTCIDGS
ncbi:hypothetical protein CBS101457_006620 [Exobasidium rhododendri]|nr:hypothetical protein CBS101457_006620 [Exobasidium rhododendri]